MSVPATLVTFADRIDRFNRAIGRAAAWLALAIVLIQFALVLARYVFDVGSIKWTESVTYGHATLIMLAAAWTLSAGGHVRVDVFYAHASVRTRAAIDLAGSVIWLIPFMLVLLWLSAPWAVRSWAVLERSQEVGGLPLVFLLKTLVPVFSVLMALQGIVQAIRAVTLLIPPPHAGEGGARSAPGGGTLHGQVTPPGSSPRSSRGSEPPSPKGEG